MNGLDLEKGTSVVAMFFTSFSKFMMNHDLEFDPLAVLNILKIINSLEFEIGAHKNTICSSNSIGFFPNLS